MLIHFFFLMWGFVCEYGLLFKIMVKINLISGCLGFFGGEWGRVLGFLIKKT